MFKQKQDLLDMNPPMVLSLGVLVLCFILVELFYIGFVWPYAAQATASQGSAAAGSIWVVLKDREQAVCIAISLYCLFLIGFKFRLLSKNLKGASTNYLLDEQGEVAPLDDVLAHLEASTKRHDTSMVTWIGCIKRFLNTGHVQDAAQAIKEKIELIEQQIEAGNNSIRYVIWAIPSIGFVGTVRGIGQALAKAEEAVGGDISGMVDKLGVAFNSTLVSLFLSIGLMLLLHFLTSLQDRVSIITRKTCEDNLLEHLHDHPARVMS